MFRRALGAFLLAVVGGLSTWVAASVAFGSDSTSLPVQLLLECDAKEQISIVYSTYAEEESDAAVSGYEDPEQSLATFLDIMASQLDPAQAKDGSSDSENHEFLFEEDGKTIAVAYAEKTGASWYVTEFADCEAVTEGSEKP